MKASSGHFERIIALEAPGGPPARVAVTVPGIVSPDERFDAHVVLLDERGYPSVEADGAAVVRLSGDEAERGRAEFEKGRPAIANVSGLSVSDVGLQRFEGEYDGATFFSNPVLCEQNPRQRLFWGDPHVHTIISNCHPETCRSLDFGYLCARYVTGLDWVCIADHVSNGRTDPGKWKAQQVASAVYDDPPHFTNLLAYEASLKGGCGGDNNVYFKAPRAEYVDEYEDGNVATLIEKLGEQEFFVVPHHTTRTGKHGELRHELYCGPEHHSNVEIYSKWGASEYRGNPDPLNKIHPGPAYVQDFLARGMRFGLMGGTDTHATMSGGYGEEPTHIGRAPGITGVWMNNLSREALYSGLQSRSCYATSGERILVRVEVAGGRGGTTMKWEDPSKPRQLKITAAAPGPIARVDVVRNAQVRTLTPDDWQAKWDFIEDDDLSEVAFDPTPSTPRPFVYYYVRVTCESGARAWTGPVWLML
ncbi:MAG: DUF3604 domain-containing protein [Armatimonadota bacterium]